MAKEKIIEIKTGPAIKSVQDLKNNIVAYKKALSELEIGTEEYQSTLQSLQENQAALRNAMHGTAASLQDVMDAATAANVAFDENNKLVQAETLSYNELVRELAILKEEWRSTTDEAERAKLGDRINNVNDRLKEMDSSVGVFGRNVGNYIGAVDHLTSGLSSMGSGATKVIGPLKGVTTGLKTMSATPVIAIIGLLANLLEKIITELKGTEEGTNKLTAAMAPFEAIMDAATKTLQILGKGIVAVIGFIGKLTEKILGNNEAAEKRLKIAQAQAELDASQRETLVKNAEAERDIAELRAKSSDKLNYTASERLAFLEEAGQKEKEISARALKDAKLQYEIIKAKNSLTQSSKEALDEEAQAYAAMVKAETDYYNSIRTINSGITQARRQEAKDAAAAAKAVKDAAVAKIAAEKEYLAALLEVTKAGTQRALDIQNAIAAKEREKAIADAKQKIKDRQELNNTLAIIDKKYQLTLEANRQAHDERMLQEELLAIANRRDVFQQGSVEYAQLQKEYASAALDGLKQQMDETDEEFRARTLAAQRELAEAGAALSDAIAKEAADGLKAQMAALRDGSVEQLALSLELAKQEVDSLYQGIDESLDEFNARRLEKEKAVREAEDALREGELDRDRTILQQRMAILEEGSIEYLSLAMEMKKLELDSLHQLEGESNEEFRLRELEAEKAYADSRKEIWKASLSIMQQAASGVSSILGTIADAYDNNTKKTKKEAEKAKNLRIAGATIDMLQGAVTAYAGAQSLGVPMGPIIGAINAAAVVATGIANIAKIKSTPISTSSSSSTSASVPAAVAAPAVQAEVTQVRTLTGASEEDRLNRMASDQRVYILESDIEAKQDQRRVEVAETTF